MGRTTSGFSQQMSNYNNSRQALVGQKSKWSSSGGGNGIVMLQDMVMSDKATVADPSSAIGAKGLLSSSSGM